MTLIPLKARSLLYRVKLGCGRTATIASTPKGYVWKVRMFFQERLRTIASGIGCTVADALDKAVKS